jgi:hypothetical protein
MRSPAAKIAAKQEDAERMNTSFQEKKTRLDRLDIAEPPVQMQSEPVLLIGCNSIQLGSVIQP